MKADWPRSSGSPCINSNSGAFLGDTKLVNETTEKRSGTVCFFVSADNKVLLGQFVYPDGRLQWSGIGGMADRGETPIQALVREIGEETAIQVAPDNLLEVYLLELEDLLLHVFVARRWSGSIEAREESLLQMRWFDFDDIPYDQMPPGNAEWLPAVLSKAHLAPGPQG